MTQAVDLANAINNFVVGCKQDGIWDPIKACCIMAAWDGLNGALYPLKGTAPTNYNFVAGDYNRETGLVGDGSTKYLDSNRNNNADPQDNFHAGLYASSVGNSGNFLSTGGAETGATRIIYAGTSCRDNSLNSYSVMPGYIGVTRQLAASYIQRVGASSIIISQASQTPVNASLLVFSGNFFTDARIAFYSIGESLDLAALDTRVSALITAIGAAIP
jgi:hypothetical protein